MPLLSARDVITMIAPPSFRSGRAFLTVTARPRVLRAKTLSKLSSVVSASVSGLLAVKRVCLSREAVGAYGDEG
jgi:hypothetical protein